MISNAQLLSEYTLHLHAVRGLSAHTVDAYTSDLTQFAEVLATRHRVYFSADKDDIAHFLQHLASHDIGPSSRARKIAALRCFYRWLLQNERLEKDPMRLTVLPKIPKLLPRPIEPQAMQQMLDQVELRAAADDATMFELRDAAILEVAYAGGLRVSELCSLRQADIMLEAGTARVLGKGKKERIVPLGRSAIAALEVYIREARPQFIQVSRKTYKKKEALRRAKALFLSEQGTEITRQRVYQIVRKLGGENVHPHRLRHSCCTDMLRNGADLRAVQEMAGHANLGTTQIYTKVTPDHLQDAHRQFHPRG